MKKIRLTALLMLPLLLVSCGDAPASDSPSALDAAKETTAAVTEPETEARPSLPDGLDFEGQSFVFGVVDNPNARNSLIMEEMTGEVLNDAQYSIISETNDALNVVLSEYLMTNSYPAADKLIPIIAAGDDAIQVANVFCVDAVSLTGGGYIRDYSGVPYVDLDKPWWDSSVNESLLIGGKRYAAIGDLSISTHDLTFALLFSKKLTENYGLESPYALITAGSWTMDKMAEQMEAVMTDVNGDGKQDSGDIFGYLANHKNVLPSFWIGAGEKTIELDDSGTPVITMDDERFTAVFEKTFTITWDNGARNTTGKEDTDVPTENRTLFASDQSLFLDCSLFWVGTLRDMESDFGIIPYPKFNEDQDSYHARVSYYMPPVIPVTVRNSELIGAVLEEANYLAYKEVRPAYYEITLKGKTSRDTESEEMLDLIFSNRVLDLGDSLLCASIRDGFMRTMYSANDRTLASKLEKNRPTIEKAIADVMGSTGD